MMSRDSGSVSVSSSRYEGGAGTVGPFKLGRVADGRVLKVLPLRWIKYSTYAVHASSSRASQHGFHPPHEHPDLHSRRNIDNSDPSLQTRIR